MAGREGKIGPPPRQARRWLAVTLSVLMPGLGHAYAGSVVRALAISAGLSLGLLPLLALIGRAATPVALASVLVAGFATYILVAIDAAKITRLDRKRFFGRGANTLACLGFVLISTTISLEGEWFRDNWIARPYRVPSGAMMPTLLVGDHFYVDPRAYSSTNPDRGDVVVFLVARNGRDIAPADRNPESLRETFIKRIVGLPGDKIRFEGAEIFVNGERKTEPVGSRTFVGHDGRILSVRPETLSGEVHEVLDDPSRRAPPKGPFTVEPDRYFMAGDNRDNSNDSRYWGTVHRSDIVGEVTNLYWSWDFNGTSAELLNPTILWKLLKGRTRWDRIGRPVK